MSDIVFKKLEVFDWMIWKQIRFEALKDSPNNFVSSYEEGINLADTHFINTVEKSSIFICFVNGDVAGCCGFSIGKELKTSHIGALWGMYIKKSFRNKGLGFLFVDYVKNYAKNYVKYLYLGSLAENIAAINLYRKCGFKIYGTRPNYNKIGDKFYDDFTMMCEL
jgi:ribosomal protein S18 acetylase RimI-like enzyme